MKIFELVKDLIHNWEPMEKYRGEENYIDDLREYLYVELNSYKGGFSKKTIEVKKTSDAPSCDILIDNKVGVDLKLTRKGEIEAGKLGRIFDEILKNRENHSKGVIFVLVGKVNPGVKGRVERRIKKITEMTKIRSPLRQFIRNDYKVELVNKGYN